MNDRQLHALMHPFNGMANWDETMATCRYTVGLGRTMFAMVVLAVDR